MFTIKSAKFKNNHYLSKTKKTISFEITVNLSCISYPRSGIIQYTCTKFSLPPHKYKWVDFITINIRENWSAVRCIALTINLNVHEQQDDIGWTVIL